MYAVKFYIEPQDVLNRLSEEDRERFNHCIFSSVDKERDGTLTITCTLFNDKDIDQESQYRYKYCDDGEIKLN